MSEQPPIPKESREKSQYARLDSLISPEQINKEKLIALESDVDEGGNTVELGDNEVAYWVELKSPIDNRVVEAKVYMPKTGGINEVTVFVPGFAGDIVAQERKFAKPFLDNNIACIFLRHNHIKVRDKSFDYIHCPERSELGGEHLGPPNTQFDFSEANSELLTALLALSHKDIKINTVGHSWGARITVASLVELADLVKEGEKHAKEVSPRIKNVAFLGGWLGTPKEGEDLVTVLRKYVYDTDPPFSGLTIGNIEEGIQKDAHKLERFGIDTLPENAVVHPISSYKDFDEEKESTYPSVMKKYVLDKLPPEKHTAFLFAHIDQTKGPTPPEEPDIDRLAQKVQAYGRSGRSGEVHDYPNAAEILAQRIISK